MIGKKEDIVVFLMNADPDKTWELKEHRKKRSLTQNAYYWVLCGQVAQKTQISQAEIHNRNLRDMSIVERVDGELIPVYLPDTDEGELIALQSETFHIKPTAQTKEGKDGKMYRCYVMLRGSHTFNTAEMSALLDLMIQEAQAQGIETMTPAQLERMRELERANEQKNKGH